MSDPIDIITPTPRRVPEAYLRAEITAFPLASEEAFRLAILELDPQLGGASPGKDDRTRKLWRSCESLYSPHTGWSLDRLVAARDLGWFGRQAIRKPVPIHIYLQKFCRSYLLQRAGVTEIDDGSDESTTDVRDHYQWLTRSLPEDLLLAGLGVDPVPRYVDSDPPLLIRRLLDLGVAEIHQHIGASMNFPLLWVSTLAALVNPEIGAEALASPGAPMGEGRFLIRWLLAAAVARCIVAEYIIRGGGTRFRDFVLRSNFLKSPAWSLRRIETLATTFRALASGKPEWLPDIEPLRNLYTDMHPDAQMLRDHPLQSVEDAYRRCDPISRRLDLRGENAGERWFLRKSLAYLGRNTPGSGQYDRYFALIFWQTVRIRCLYYRTVIQRPLTGGLQWFIRFYERPGKLRAPLEPILPEVSYHIDGAGHRIKALEFRTTAANTAIENGDYLLEIVRSWRRVLEEICGPAFEPELGLIIHFAKLRDDGRTWFLGVPPGYWAGTHTEPHKHGSNSPSAECGRFTTYFTAQARKARALAELIEAAPSCLWLLRGLDIATDEMAIPTWVFVPLFRHVLDTGAKVSIRKGAGPPLRVTAHVGEDFRHLQEGLRRIYEQVHYLLGNAGGRLGHAVALGVEPLAWAESVGSILMPAEERLWDLVWEWRMYSKYRIKPHFGAAAPPGRMDMLLNQVRELSEWVFGHDKSERTFEVMHLAEAHHMLHRFLVPPQTVKPVVDTGFKTFSNAAENLKFDRTATPVRFSKVVTEILGRYLDDESVFVRGQKLIDTPIRSDEVAALSALQFALRRGIAHSGIVIEVNPSSNLMIGDLLDLRNHPILRLFPPVPEPDAPPPVAIALGSDDPLTFSTQLLHEYSLLHQAACAMGYPDKVVQDWLESIRRTGMDARFTKSWWPNAATKAKVLEQDLCRFLSLSYLNRCG